MSITFELVSFAIGNTRALHNDTDYVAAALTHNGQLMPVQARKAGDVNNGTHAVGFAFSIPDTYNYSDTFTFSYLVMNHGGGKTQDVLAHCQNALTQTPLTAFSAADAALVKLANGQQVPRCLSTSLRAKDDMSGWWNQIKPQFSHLDSNHCDGPVAIDRFSFTGSELDTLILTNSFSIVYLGLDSAIGCGSDSDYSVQWTVNVLG
jgi:hypothetical protein